VAVSKTVCSEFDSRTAHQGAMTML
jgi:hypothetical protein